MNRILLLCIAFYAIPFIAFPQSVIIDPPPKSRLQVSDDKDSLRIPFVQLFSVDELYAQRQKEKVDELDSIVVAANKARVVKRTQISAVSLPASVMFAMPATMGEPDVLKSLQMIPGVVGAGDGNVALHIRGGSSSQNLFIVDGAVLYNPEHFKGYVSAINPVAVNDVLLYKGGFPAQYGNRLSGIVDTELKRGDFNTYHGTANVGLFAASAMVSGPIIKDKLSFMVAGRRSFYKEVTSNIVDLLYKEEVKKEGMQTSKESVDVPFDNVIFYDFNAKLSYKPNKRNIIDLSFYNGKDINDIESDDKYTIETANEKTETKSLSENKEKWGNVLASLNWNYRGEKVEINTNASYSKYFYDKSFSNRTENLNYKLDTGISQIENKTKEFSKSRFKSDIERLQFANKYSIKNGILKGLELGIDAAYIRYNPYNAASRQIIESIIDPIYHNKVKDTMIEDTSAVKGGSRDLITGGIFANYNLKIGDAVEVDAGIRGSVHVTDGKTYIYPEPRVNALLNISPKLALKASYSFMVQSEHKVSTEDLLEDSDVWMPSGKGIKPSTSHQVAAGVFYDFKDKRGFAVSLEGYYKIMDDILEYKEGSSSAMDAREWEESIAVGKGWAYGLEFLAQKTTGKTKGWLSYTWSRSMEQFNRPGMIINLGKEFLAPHDCRNNVTLNVTRELGKNFELSATFAYHTGRYRTLYNLQYMVLGRYNPYYAGQYYNNMYAFKGELELQVANKRNNVKIDDYHKLDIAINYRNYLL